MGFALAMLDCHENAISALDRARAIADATGAGGLRVNVRKYVALVHLRRGEIAVAISEATACIQEARAIGYREAEAGALAVLALALLKHGDVLKALDAANSAMLVRNEVGGIGELESEIFAAQVDTLHECGRGSEAESFLVVARQRLAEVASRITDSEWRRRFLEDVPAHRELLRRTLGAEEGA
jgi:hypothetical protein